MYRRSLLVWSGLEQNDICASRNRSQLVAIYRLSQSVSGRRGSVDRLARRTRNVHPCGHHAQHIRLAIEANVPGPELIIRREPQVTLCAVHSQRQRFLSLITKHRRPHPRAD
jgi:hypothetical protein